MRNPLLKSYAKSLNRTSGATSSVPSSVTGPLWLSLLLHIGILVLVFGDFKFWDRPDDIQEIVIEAIILPDAKEGAVEKIAKRKPIPPPPPPPPKPPQPPEPKATPTPSPEPTPPEPPKEAPPEEPIAAPTPPEEVPNAEEFSQSVLKTLEELRPQTPQGEDDETTQKPISGVAKNIPQLNQNVKQGAALNVQETQALRQALAECWSVAAGAAGGSDNGGLRVDVRISFRPDGSLLQAEVLERARMQSDATFRAVAEDALRALHHPKCQRLPLPPEKYESWKTIIFEFDPSQMIG